MQQDKEWRSISERNAEINISTKQVFDGALLKVWKDEVELPNGKTSGREYIKHPGASVVLPVFANGDVMLVGQYRYPVGDVFLEVPAGKLDPNETPLQTAKRELQEEAGLTCKNLVQIGSFHPCVGYSDEIIHLFIGWNIKEQDQNPDDDEFLTRHRFPFKTVLEMIESGDITDSKTIITVLRAERWWRKHEPFEVSM